MFRRFLLISIFALIGLATSADPLTYSEEDQICDLMVAAPSFSLTDLNRLFDQNPNYNAVCFLSDGDFETHTPTDKGAPISKIWDDFNGKIKMPDILRPNKESLVEGVVALELNRIGKEGGLNIGIQSTYHDDDRSISFMNTTAPTHLACRTDAKGDRCRSLVGKREELKLLPQDLFDEKTIVENKIVSVEARDQLEIFETGASDDSLVVRYGSILTAQVQPEERTIPFTGYVVAEIESSPVVYKVRFLCRLIRRKP